MIKRILRPEILRYLGLGLAMAAIFASTVLLMQRLLPRPHTPADYLIMGGLATFVCMLALLAVLATSILKAPTTLFKRRK